MRDMGNREEGVAMPEPGGVWPSFVRRGWQIVYQDGVMLDRLLQGEREDAEREFRTEEIRRGIVKKAKEDIRRLG